MIAHIGDWNTGTIDSMTAIIGTDRFAHAGLALIGHD